MRQISESPLYMGPEEKISWTWDSSSVITVPELVPVNPVVKLYREQDDVSGDHLTGLAQVQEKLIIFPQLHSIVLGQDYVLSIQFQAGSQIISQFSRLYGQYRRPLKTPLYLGPASQRTIKFDTKQWGATPLVMPQNGVFTILRGNEDVTVIHSSGGFSLVDDTWLVSPFFHSAIPGETYLAKIQFDIQANRFVMAVDVIGEEF